MNPRTLHRTTTSFKALRRRMMSYGLSKGYAELAHDAMLRAISELLLEGKPVNLYKLGTFRFQFRAGRTIVSRKPNTFPSVQKESWCLKFKVSDLFRKQLKDKKVIPIYGRIPKPPVKPRT